MDKIVLLIVSLLLISCEKTKTNDRSGSDTTQVMDSLKMDLSFSVEELEQAPSWFKSLPEKEGCVYATGIAKSRRANIASDKALMNAQVILADKLKNLGLSSDAIGADSDPSNDNLSIIMKDVLVKNKKQIKSGDIWYTYILIELKLEK